MGVLRRIAAFLDMKVTRSHIILLVVALVTIAVPSFFVGRTVGRREQANESGNALLELAEMESERIMHLFRERYADDPAFTNIAIHRRTDRVGAIYVSGKTTTMEEKWRVLDAVNSEYMWGQVMDGITVAPPDMEVVLAKAQIAIAATSSIELSDGTLLRWPESYTQLVEIYMCRPSWRTVREAMAVAERNLAVRAAALNLVGGLLVEPVDKPFKVQRAVGERDYWVIRWPTNEAKVAISPDDDLESAMASLKLWLAENAP